MPIEYLRVTDEVKPKREYSIVASAYDESIHTIVDKPATNTDGTPLATKYTPQSLSGKSGQSAETTKEK